MSARPRLEVLEQFTLACGAGEALRSFMTTTHDTDASKLGWKYTCCKFPADNGPVVFREGPCFATQLEFMAENSEDTKWAGPSYLPIVCKAALEHLRGAKS
jgi:hypothetical protein